MVFFGRTKTSQTKANTWRNKKGLAYKNQNPDKWKKIDVIMLKSNPWFYFCLFLTTKLEKAWETNLWVTLS